VFSKIFMKLVLRSLHESRVIDFPLRIHPIALVLLLGFVVSVHAQKHLTDDRELAPLDLNQWQCLDKPGGTAKSGDGVERNALKNRTPIDVSGRDIPLFDFAKFLQHVAAFDTQTKQKRRKDLAPAERQQLGTLEKELVSFTGYLVLAYPGPPESTNCGSVDFHDWHLELFEKPQDHAPRPGDPTPIICEITPRTQNAVYNDGVRIQKLAGFFRGPNLETEPTGQPPQLVRVTGYLCWDDEHNGTADVGTNVQRIASNKYHQPWRATAWEIHPVLKIEPANASSLAPQVAPSAAPQVAPSVSAAPATQAAPAAPAPQPPAAPKVVTIVEPVRIKIPYGETVLPRGMKLPFVGRDTQSVRVNYMGQTVVVPLQSTDLR
jgi:hypothetical protein